MVEDLQSNDFTRHSFIEVGVVVKPHGIKGAVKVRLHNPDFFEYPIECFFLQIPSGKLEKELRLVRRSKDHILLQVKNIQDRKAAETLKGSKLYLDRKYTCLEEGEFFYVDLIGCKVIEGVINYGVVTNLLNFGACDILVVRDGAFERMIPFVKQWIQSVDLEKKTIEILDGEQWEASAH